MEHGELVKHFIVFYCFFSKPIVEILVTRHTGDHSAIWGPLVPAQEDYIARKAIQANPYNAIHRRMISQDAIFLRVERRA